MLPLVSTKERRMSRERVLAICLILIFSLSLTSCGGRSEGPANAFAKQLRSALNDYLDKDAQLKHWKLLDARIVAHSQQNAAEEQANSAKEQAAYFDVDRRYRLDYANVEDMPALKGRLAFLRDYEHRLSGEQLKKAKKDIKAWRRKLVKYIGVDQRILSRIKVAGKFDVSKKLLPGSTSFFVETDGSTDYDAAYAPLSLKEIPTPQETEKSAYESIRDTVGITGN